MRWEFSENSKYVLTNLLTVSRWKFQPRLQALYDESTLVEAVFVPIIPATFAIDANLATDDSPCPF
jgi:hypothetical protein